MINLNNKRYKNHTHVYSDTKTTGLLHNNKSKAKGVKKGEETSLLLDDKNIKLTDMLYEQSEDVVSAKVVFPLALLNVPGEKVGDSNVGDGVVVVAGVFSLRGRECQGHCRDGPLGCQGGRSVEISCWL